MSWNAVLPYKGKPANPAEIARSLAVRYQVEGNVRQTGDRVRVNAQLVDTGRAGAVVGEFRRGAGGSLCPARQDHDANCRSSGDSRFAGSSNGGCSPSQPQILMRTTTCCARGPLYCGRTRADIVQARALLKQAIELDPNYAAAYAALAETYYTAVTMGWAEQPADFLSSRGGNGEQGA